MALNNCNIKFHADTQSENNTLIIDSLNLSNLPEEILRIIFQFLNFDTVANIRLVCQKFNVICKSMLNLEFKKLQNEVEKRYQLSLNLPRQVPLSCKRQIVIYLSEEFYKLQALLGKHLNDGCCCFFAGKILDEINVALRITDNYKDEREIISIKYLPKALQILNNYYLLFQMLFSFIESYKHFYSDDAE